MKEFSAETTNKFFQERRVYYQVQTKFWHFKHLAKSVKETLV